MEDWVSMGCAFGLYPLDLGPGTIGVMADVMLASGDNAITVAALGQANEIGRMAAAVQVFKDGAAARLKLEADAAEGHRRGEERARDETGRAEKAACKLPSWPRSLPGSSSWRKATSQPVSPLPFWQRTSANFNAGLQKLAEAMARVSSSATVMRSGTKEISTASVDLSRRTEQQAGSLEETTAALGETLHGAQHRQRRQSR